MRKYFLSSICSLLNTFCIRNIFRSCKTRCVKTAIHSYQNCYEFRLLRYLAVFGNFVHYPASFSIHFGISSHRLYKYWTTFLKYWCKSSKASFNSPCNRFWVFKLKKSWSWQAGSLPYAFLMPFSFPSKDWNAPESFAAFGNSSWWR